MKNILFTFLLVVSCFGQGSDIRRAGPTTGGSSTNFQGVLTVPNGGLGNSNFTSNALLVGNGTNAITSGPISVSNGTNATLTGNLLVNGATFTNAVTVPNGGTGVATITSGNIPQGQGTSPITTSPLNVSGNTNVALTGNLLANGATFTNALGASSGGTGSSVVATNGTVLVGNGTIYRPAATTDFTVDVTNHRVGIGTASPTAGYKLEVSGSSIYSNGTENNTILSVANGIQFTSGFNAIRQDTSHRLNIDVYNGGSAVNAIQIAQNGNVTFSGTISASNLTSGTYTPTATIVANLDSASVSICQYMRVGNTVTVSGRITVDPTTTSTDTQLGLSLPIASAISSADQVGGTAYSPAIAAQGAAILGDATNDRATVQWKAADITSQPMYFSFTYQIL